MTPGTEQHAPSDVTQPIGDRRSVVIDARRHDAVLFDLSGVVAALDSTVALARRLRHAHIATAVYASNMDCTAVLHAAGLDGVFDVQVAGQSAEGGEPDPGLLLEAAGRLGTRPDRCVVVDQTRAGVLAGRNGGFGMVVGFDATDRLDDLIAWGADAAVTDPSSVTVRAAYRRVSDLDKALASVEMLGAVLATRQAAVFADFDGTLSPIVDDPAAASILPLARDALTALAASCPVAILSGRDVLDVRARVDVPGLWYAGNHGLEIVSPVGAHHDNGEALSSHPALSRAEDALREQLNGIPGAEVERKRHAVAVHYRRVEPQLVAAVISAVHIAGRRESLRVMHGRKVIELRPDMDWDKGTALLWIASQLGAKEVTPLYLGDDLTDEDAFDAVERDGIGIVVGHDEDGDRLTSARLAVDDPQQVAELLTAIESRFDTEQRQAHESWSVTFDGYDPGDELHREVLCGIGNGYIGTRGSAPEAKAGASHYPGTYCAGVYNRLTDRIGESTVDNESIVNLPNWLPLTFAIDAGQWFDLDGTIHDIVSYRQTIDLRRAELLREFRVRDDSGRVTSVSERRFVSMHDPHLCALSTTVTADNWSGTVRFRSTIDGGVANSGVRRYRDLSGRHLSAPLFSAAGVNAVACETQTVQSHIRIAMAARTVISGQDLAHVDRHALAENTEAGDVISVAVTSGQSVTVEKTVAIYTSRDRAISEPREAAERAVARVGGYDAHLEDHQTAWSHLWEGFQLQLDGDVERLRDVRLHIFHLLQCVSPHLADCDAGIPARGLHGEAYRGHVFWDDLFVVPVLNLRLPDVTRSILRYRYRRLGEACRSAAAAGYSGAMFPWQSGSDGREMSQKLHLNPRSGRWNLDPSALANHVGAAIAYTVWQYYQVTGDLMFLTNIGTEILVQVARFWASRARFDPSRDRYVIDGVIGPDEFHTGYPGRPSCGVDNNAYTNIMAVWTILRAMEALDALPTPDRLDLVESLHLHGTELALWDQVSRRMFVPFHEGVISQFEGYENLPELDWARYRERYGNLGRMDRILEAEGDDVNNYKVSKQADTVMLFYLLSADELRDVLGRLGYPFSPAQVPGTIDYYLNRTTHGSTLSAVVHSWVLARGNRAQATDYFQQVLASDIADIQGGTTAEGVHLAAMAGSVDLLQRCYTGLEARNDRLILGPMWPEDAGPLRFSIRYRGHRLHLRISGRSARVVADPSTAPPITVECRGHIQTLPAGAAITVG
ncbi:MAG TPA: trehalose-phosphatase [Mycobacterium sp.]|nr:trehalose-phosphatase [Mycobacterium sp.]